MDEIFTVNLTLTTECQIDGGEFVKSSFFKNVDGIVKIRKEVVKIWNFLPICLESYVSEKNQANVKVIYTKYSKQFKWNLYFMGLGRAGRFGQT